MYRNLLTFRIAMSSHFTKKFRFEKHPAPGLAAGWVSLKIGF